MMPGMSCNVRIKLSTPRHCRTRGVSTGNRARGTTERALLEVGFQEQIGTLPPGHGTTILYDVSCRMGNIGGGILGIGPQMCF